MADSNESAPPELAAGVELQKLPPCGLLAVTADGEEAILVRGASGLFAVGGRCNHLGGPLAEGIVVGDTVRCPWHHACFSAASGAAVAAPAFERLPRWPVEVRDGQVYLDRRDAARVSSRSDGARPHRASGRRPSSPEKVVIIGGGAGGYATADALLKLGFSGSMTVVDRDGEATYDRTLLSKDYLDGSFGEAQLPIEGEPLEKRGVVLRRASTAVRIDREAKVIHLEEGERLPYTKVVLASGAEPRRLPVPGNDLAHVTTLRSAQDARRILAAAKHRKKMVVVGGSFIGLEVAASLRQRGFEVTVVAPDAHPFASILGRDLSDALLSVHREHGVAFELERYLWRVDGETVELDDGTVLEAELVILGVGVEPRVHLAEQAGLHVDDGVQVDPYLRTSDPDIYAVGDIARWPDPYSGERIRVEHWNVALRQGQVAAMNIAGHPTPYAVVPFFWTMHFDFSVRYVGHATHWDESQVHGSLAERDAEVRFLKGGEVAAIATVNRDRAALEYERDLERRVLGARSAAALPI